MSPPQPYTPIDTFPDLDGTGGGGPLTLLEDGDVYLYKDNIRSDSDIQSIANTTPIQVTTATAHGFITGNTVTIVSAAVSAANGTFVITKISGSIFSLDGSTAAGAGGAFGRVFNAKLGIISRLIDGLQWLKTKAYDRLAGIAYSDIVVLLNGRTKRRPRVVLSDADHTIDTSEGDCFELDGAPAAPRVIKLRTTTAPIPTSGERIEVIAPAFNSGVLDLNIYQVQRENGTLIASFYGRNPAKENVSAQFEFTGTKWRLGINSGWDASGAGYGVLAGTDA
jgi:hypothetical protein